MTMIWTKRLNPYFLFMRLSPRKKAILGHFFDFFDKMNKKSQEVSAFLALNNIYMKKRFDSLLMDMISWVK